MNKKIKRNWYFYKKTGFSPIILSDGMPRSGSTLLFNILRLSLETKFNTRLSSGWIKDCHKLEKGDIYLIKCHGCEFFKRKRASKIFYSYRDIRDCLVSANKKFGMEPTIKVVDKWIKHYSSLRRDADCLFKYEDMMQDIPKTIDAVLKALQINSGTSSVLNKLDALKNESSSNRYSKENLFHKDHITGTEPGEWEALFSSSFKSELMTKYKWWFLENDYPL